METLQSTDSQAKRLDAFQLKGLRKILGLVSTFIDRNNTNAKVFEEANKHWKSMGANGKTNVTSIIPVSKLLQVRNITLLGYILRRKEDPMLNVALNLDYTPKESYKKRVRRPKQKWVHSQMEKAWKLIKQDEV